MFTASFSEHEYRHECQTLRRVVLALTFLLVLCLTCFSGAYAEDRPTGSVTNDPDAMEEMAESAIFQMEHKQNPSVSKIIVHSIKGGEDIERGTGWWIVEYTVRYSDGTESKFRTSYSYVVSGGIRTVYQESTPQRIDTPELSSLILTLMSTTATSGLFCMRMRRPKC